MKTHTAVATISPGMDSVGRSKAAYSLLIKLWPLGKVLYWLSNRPVIGPLLEPYISSAGDEAIIISVYPASCILLLVSCFVRCIMHTHGAQNHPLRPG